MKILSGVATFLLLAVLLAGILPAQPQNSPRAGFLSGDRPALLILEGMGEPPTVCDHVRLEPSESPRFVVSPMKSVDGISHEYWIPLEKVKNIIVFNSTEDANRYAAATYRSNPSN